jgi:NAD(P)H-nitrite reductase large subunit
MRLGVAAAALDVANRTVIAADGRAVAADGVIIATGSAPRALPVSPTSMASRCCALDDSWHSRRRLSEQPQWS